MDNKVLTEKYVLIVENEQANANVENLLGNVNTLINKSVSDSIEGQDLSNAFNQLLLALLNSSDVNIKNAATKTLNSGAPKAQPQIAAEEDGAIGSSDDETFNRDAQKGVGF